MKFSVRVLGLGDVGVRANAAIERLLNKLRDEAAATPRFKWGGRFSPERRPGVRRHAAAAQDKPIPDPKSSGR